MPIDWDSHRRLSKDEYTRWEEAVSDHWRLPRRIDGGVEPLNWQVPRRDLTYFERWDAEESGLERDTIVTLSGAAADAAMASRSSHVAALQRSLGRPGCDPLIAVVDHGDALAVELPAESLEYNDWGALIFDPTLENIVEFGDDDGRLDFTAGGARLLDTLAEEWSEYRALLDWLDTTLGESHHLCAAQWTQRQALLLIDVAGDLREVDLRRDVDEDSWQHRGVSPPRHWAWMVRRRED